ncbi:MAG: DegT/DnrJ/EryC1/StrS family aminotransferase [Rhizomicrobium sp.]
MDSVFGNDEVGGNSMKKIPVSGPWITEKEVRYVADAAENAWFDNANVFHQRFERAFADYLGVKHAVTLPSCTSALHLSLAAMGVGPGDEVIVPESTWIASSAPITYVGATPVFVDVDRETWCMDVGSLTRAITPQTKAVITVDLYGSMPDMDGLRDVLRPHGIPLIEDAAEAIGSRLRGKLAGSLGDVGTFSFHGSKTMTTGEGGMLVTDDSVLFDRVMRLRDHGRKPGDRMFFNEEVGFKYKMSSMQAALGLAQLERIEELIARKREIFSWYRENLAGVNGLRLNHDSEEMRNSFWMDTVILSPDFGFKTVDVMAQLEEQGIDSRPFFHPLSSLPAYREYPSAQGARERNPVAYEIAACGINLPSGLQLTRPDVDRVCDVLANVLRGAA